MGQAIYLPERDDEHNGIEIVISAPTTKPPHGGEHTYDT